MVDLLGLVDVEGPGWNLSAWSLVADPHQHLVSLHEFNHSIGRDWASRIRYGLRLVKNVDNILLFFFLVNHVVDCQEKSVFDEYVLLDDRVVFEEVANHLDEPVGHLQLDSFHVSQIFLAHLQFLHLACQCLDSLLLDCL